jgi:TPR repeat protein
MGILGKAGLAAVVLFGSALSGGVGAIEYSGVDLDNEQLCLVAVKGTYKGSSSFVWDPKFKAYMNEALKRGLTPEKCGVYFPVVQETETSTPTPMTECDRLAAHPHDPMKLGAGIEADKVDGIGAIKACEAAVKAYPDAERLWFQMGRAFDIQDDYSKSIHWYRKAVERGYSAAQNNLGLMYARGEGVTKDHKEALKWFRKAAEQGHAVGQRNTGLIYEKGEGVTKDYKEAVKWYRKAAEQGYASAQNNLGFMYMNGEGVTKDYGKALKWFRLAAEQGHADAQTNVGWIYANFEGIKQDFVEAVKWYRKAAEQGEPNAQNNLGVLYENGNGVKLDVDIAIQWYRKAANQDHEIAKNNLKKLSKLLADRKAFTALLKRAESGDAEAQFKVADEHNGGSFFNDAEVVTQWYIKAANQGHAKAQNKLGDMYEDGTGVKRNPRLAIKWFTKAATQGLASAQHSLGIMYGKGLGVIQDEVEALKWLYLSSAQGVGAGDRDKQVKMMSPGQIAQAKRLAKAWKPSADPEAPSPTPTVSKPNKALLEALAPIREAHRDAVAVVIGNRDYKGEVPQVSYAISDATAVSAMLQNRLGYRVGNIIDLRDATLNDMAAVLGNERTPEGKLHDWIKPGQSDVFVFYSGHGVPGLKDKRPYLLPVDGDANRAEITGYPLDVLYKNLAKLSAKSVTVFIDACFSGDSPKGMIVKSASGISLEARLPKSAKSMTVITAAQGDQLASWDEKAKHGLFTKHLLEALEGKADSKRYGNEDGEVSLAEVRNYLDQEMTYQARRRFGRTQQASVRGDADTVLSTVLDLPKEEDDGIEEMDAHYKVLKTANIRSGPGTTHDIVGKLEVNQSVNVTGKVIGKNWFRLGDGTFVFGSLLGVVN